MPNMDSIMDLLARRNQALNSARIVNFKKGYSDGFNMNFQDMLRLFLSTGSLLFFCVSNAKPISYISRFRLSLYRPLYRNTFY